MNWVDVASNQCFSYDTLQNAVTNGYFVLKNTIPTNSKQLTVSEAQYYVYIVPITGKTSNQLPVKSNLTAATLLPYSYTLYYDYDDSLPYVVGFTTSAAACATTINSFMVYSSSASVGIGTALYFDAYGTEPISATASTYYYKISGSYVIFEPYAPEMGTGYIINSIGTCSVCEQYEIQNFTESAIGIDYYNCSGIQIFDSIGSGNNLVFCSDTSYGPINSGGGSLYLLGICP